MKDAECTRSLLHQMQVKAVALGEIESICHPAMRCPTEAELEAGFGARGITVEQALGELVAQSSPCRRSIFVWRYPISRDLCPLMS